MWNIGNAQYPSISCYYYCLHCSWLCHHCTILLHIFYFAYIYFPSAQTDTHTIRLEYTSLYPLLRCSILYSVVINPFFFFAEDPARHKTGAVLRKNKNHLCQWLSTLAEVQDHLRVKNKNSNKNKQNQTKKQRLGPSARDSDSVGPKHQYFLRLPTCS